MELDIGGLFEWLIAWLTANFSPFFDGVTTVVRAIVDGLEAGLLFLPGYLLIVIFALIAWRLASRQVGIFTLLGLLLLKDNTFTLFGLEISLGMGLWELTMETLALVLTATLFSLLIGLPLGILASKSDYVEQSLRPVLDFMQTMPAFVYLIPAVLLFGLGEVPGVIATFIFATPPAVRLTNLGIRQVPEEVVEAARSFGSTPAQMLTKVELPMALPTILAGVNQTIMLSLSMVVIAGLIGAGGLGNEVVTGIMQLDISTGFEGGIAIVILAIFLDRITQAVGKRVGVQDQPATA